MIKITENGMEFVMRNVVSGGHALCDNCPIQGNFKGGCSETIKTLCETSEYWAISASPVQHEPKVYGPHNCEECEDFAGKEVEAFDLNRKKWLREMLVRIRKNDVAAFDMGDWWSCSIREIQTVKKTWSQIQSEMPEMANVELIPEDKKENDDE